MRWAMRWGRSLAGVSAATLAIAAFAWQLGNPEPETLLASGNATAARAPGALSPPAPRS